MNKVTKLEVVAITYVNGDGLPSFTPTTYGVCALRQGDAVITTDQAEAYAAERVREALELAAQEANDWAMQYVEVDSSPHRVGDYIRALITKE